MRCIRETTVIPNLLINKGSLSSWSYGARATYDYAAEQAAIHSTLPENIFSALAIYFQTRLVDLVVEWPGK